MFIGPLFIISKNWKQPDCMSSGEWLNKLWCLHTGNTAHHKEGWTTVTRNNLDKSQVQFSCSVVSISLQPHGLQHTRLPCPSPTPTACSNSCPSSRWCHPTISSSVVPFSSCLQTFPASGSFPRSQFFTSGGQSIGISASASVLPMKIQVWIVCSNPFCIVCCPWGHWRAKRQWVVPVFIRIKKWLYQLQPELCWCHPSELAPFQWVNILPPSP